MTVAANLTKIRQRMERIDALPKELRELIHEEGLTVVQAFLDIGVRKASQIRHLIMVTRRGSLDIGNGFENSGQDRVQVMIPMEPTEAMIEASMTTVSGFDVMCTKYEKHKLRLRAAIKAGMSRIA